MTELPVEAPLEEEKPAEEQRAPVSQYCCDAVFLREEANIITFA